MHYVSCDLYENYWNNFFSGCPSLCHRCLKQEAKFKAGEIESISQYCPLDLFSGDLNRMKRAILDLYENPHNRFKIFKNGQMMYTDKIGNHAEVDQELSQFFNLSSSLKNQFHENHESHNNIGKGTNYLASILCNVLLNQTALDRELLNLVPEKKLRSKFCNSNANPLPHDCILSILLALQKYSGGIDDTKAEALSHKLMGEVKSPEEVS